MATNNRTRPAAAGALLVCAFACWLLWHRAPDPARGERAPDARTAATHARSHARTRAPAPAPGAARSSSTAPAAPGPAQGIVAANDYGWAATGAGCSEDAAFARDAWSDFQPRYFAMLVRRSTDPDVRGGKEALINATDLAKTFGLHGAKRAAFMQDFVSQALTKDARIRRLVENHDAASVDWNALYAVEWESEAEFRGLIAAHAGDEKAQQWISQYAQFLVRWFAMYEAFAQAPFSAGAPGLPASAEVDSLFCGSLRDYRDSRAGSDTDAG